MKDKETNKNTKKDTKQKRHNIHEGHRARVRKRFIQNGSLDTFEYHQILELILFYCLKMGDTNALAHRILDTYDGSFSKLLDAGCKDIMKKCKLSETTAVLISSIPHLYKKYTEDKLSKSPINSYENACDYFNNVINHFTDSFYILYTDVSKKPIKMVNVGASIEKSYVKDIVEEALLLKASYIIICHNVMELGYEQPSDFDIQVSSSIWNSFDIFDIMLLDYIVFYQDDKCYSFFNKELFDYLK